MNSEYFVSFRNLESNFSCLFVLIELILCFFFGCTDELFSAFGWKGEGFLKLTDSSY